MSSKKFNFLMSVQEFFVDHLGKERGLSKNTILAYRDAVKDFLKFVSQNKKKSSLSINGSMLSADLVLNYLSSLEKERSLSVRTRNHRLACLKTFFSYLAATDLENIGNYQRIGMIAMKKSQSKMIDYLTEKEMAALFNESSLADDRHHLLLTLLFNTGARVQEICDLRVGDLIWGPPPSVYLTGKGNKTRQVPIWPKTAEMLREYLISRDVDRNLKAHVIINQKGLPMTRFGALHVIKTLGKRAIKHQPSLKAKRISPHTLRHTTAMHLLQSGVDLSIIKMWLGHVNLNTTHGYVEIDVEMKRKALIKSKKLKPAHELKAVVKKHADVIEWLESL